jgi:hypothetical protein
MSMTPVEPPPSSPPPLLIQSAQPPPTSAGWFVVKVLGIAALIIVGLFVVTFAALMVVGAGDSY